MEDVIGSSNDGPGTLSNSRHVKKQDGVTGNHEEKATIETESQIVQLLPVVDKDFKIALINMLQKIKEKKIGNFTRCQCSFHFGHRVWCA